MSKYPQLIARAFLFIIGCVLLLGGGVCTLTNSYFVIIGAFNHDLLLIVLLLCISLLALASGWKLIAWVLAQFNKTKHQ